MKRSAALALSFAAISVAAVGAGALLHRLGLLPLRRAEQIPAAEPTCPCETPAAQEAAKKTFRDGRLQEEAADAPTLEDSSPIFEFQLVETEEIRA